MNRRPYAPPDNPDDEVTTDTFDDLPSDVELDFNDRRHPDNFEPESDDDHDLQDDPGEGMFDDDMFVPIEDEGVY